MQSEVPAAGTDQDRGQTVEELKRELAEARGQRIATSALLKVIGRSTFDLEPVFQTIAENAVRLCGAEHASIWRFDGQLLRVLVTHNISSERKAFIERNPIVPGRDSAVGRASLQRRTIHIHDAQTDPELTYGSYGLQTDPTRTVLVIPMLKVGELLGVIFVHRNEVLPFTDSQIALIETFADQAVIAIENTRLFEAEQAGKRELQESLEYQTATSEVLNVISRSPSQLQPVVDAIVQTAERLCSAERATLWRWREGNFDLLAHTIIDPALTKYLKDNPIPPDRTSLATRAVLEGRTMHVPDLQAEPELGRKNQVVIGKIRTLLAVPLLRKGEPIGVLSLSKSEVEPFSDTQIALVETFADQAVIAIENTRLFEAEQARTKELTESLAHQTATADILRVISGSPTDVTPVFDEIVQTGVRLLATDAASLFLTDGKTYSMPARATPDGLVPNVGITVLPVDPTHNFPSKAVVGKCIVHLPDWSKIDLSPHERQMHERWGINSALFVPLMRGSDCLGVLSFSCKRAREFTAKEIAMASSFRDQAVIAIENTRLFEEVQTRNRELRIALEQQTVTSELLKVIGRSTFDLQPVFETLAENAVRLCEAERALIFRFDGELLRAVATHNVPPELKAFIAEHPQRPGRGSTTARAALERRTNHVHDIHTDPDYTYGARQIEPATRIMLAIPMLRLDELLGVVTIFRHEVKPFSDSQISLMETFADQAAIAIENTRLFEEVQARNRELRVSLEQQTATSELLKVIGRSAFDLQPVFETLAENAVKLCEAERSFIFRFDGQLLRVVATHNASAEMRAFVEQNPQVPGRGSATARAALERRTIHILDVQADPEYTYKSRQVDPFRTILTVPILRVNELLGVIVIYRQEVRPFSDGQIALLETFADQAGIAIENTRLFQEVQARNRDLTALGEVGRAVGSTLDLKVVLKTIVDRAVELSATDAGSIFYLREQVGRFELGETAGIDEEVVTRYRKLDIARGETGLGEVIANRQPLQVADLTQRASNPLRDAGLEAGMRAVLAVPLLGSDGPLGALMLQRRRPGEFPQAVVSLMQAFADQSAIALENARLFEEIAQKSRELEIASQHKSQFVANMSHELRTPLAAILGYAELMQEGFYEPQGKKSLDALTRIRSNGKHLLGLINTVLDIAKIESGQFSLNLSDYALENVVETVRAATESLAETKKLALKTDVGKKLPVGLGDEQRLTQVLLNLVGNAIKFTDAGEVRITASAMNGHFTVAVTDTGPGIPPQELNRVFEQFHQIDNSNTKAKGGTGLGLAIAKQIVEMHGGRIWVESTLGRGATFQMQVPIRAEAKKAAE